MEGISKSLKLRETLECYKKGLVGNSAGGFERPECWVKCGQWRFDSQIFSGIQGSPLGNELEAMHAAPS